MLPSASRRGAEIQGTGLAEECRRRELEVEIVALRAASGADALPVPVAADGAPLSIATLRSIRGRAAHVDVVIAYGSVSLPACALAMRGLGTCFVYRSIGNPRSWARGHLHRARTGVMFRRADHVVALFNGAAEAIHDMYRVPRSKVSVIPNARDGSSISPATEGERQRARTALELPADAPVVLQIGSLAAEKRVELGIEAVARLPPGAHLLLVGDGPESAAVAAAAQRVGDRIRLVGNLSDVTPALHAADVILSTSRTEGMPGVLIEAALAGVPAVATDVGASAEVVGDGGIVVPIDASPSDIAAALIDVIADRAELGRRARLRALEQFTWDVVAPDWVRLLTKLVETRRSPHPDATSS